MATQNLVHANANNFEQLIANKDGLTLVDFWATWCGPCRSLNIYLERVAEEFPDSLRIVKVNTEELPEIATQFGVQVQPTLLWFRNGELIGRDLGNPGSIPKLRKLVETRLASS